MFIRETKKNLHMYFLYILYFHSISRPKKKMYYECFIKVSVDVFLMKQEISLTIKRKKLFMLLIFYAELVIVVNTCF